MATIMYTDNSTPEQQQRAQNYDSNEIATLRPEGSQLPRKMIISPNLVAALEYDERKRSSSPVPSLSSDALVRTVSVSSVNGGLPPPPRAKGIPSSRSKPKSPPQTPLSEKLTPSPDTPSSANDNNAATIPSRNPFINPAPRLSRLFQEERRQLSTSVQVPYHPASAPSSPLLALEHSTSINMKSSSALSSQTTSFIGTPLSSRLTQSISIEETQQGAQRHRRFLSSLPRVDKMFGKDRNSMLKRVGSPICGSSSGEAQSEVNENDQTMMRERRVEGTSMLTGIAALPTSVGLKASTTDGQASSSSSGASSARLTPVAASVALKNADTRADVAPVASSMPTVSHGSQQFLVSRPSEFGQQKVNLDKFRDHDEDERRTSLSSLDGDSDSSHEPPSTPSEAARISISSTIYPDSSNHAHSIDTHFYPPQLSTGRPSMNSDRVSFIELTSPTFPPFDLANLTIDTHNARTYHELTSNSASRADTHSASSISKPPIPASPKPNFRRSKSVQPPSQRSSLEAPRDSQVIPADSKKPSRDVPPTTNFLDPHERADRVRKARKLTQMFGQTPGPMLISQNAYESNPPSSYLSATTVSSVRRSKHHKNAVSIAEEHPYASAVPESRSRNSSLSSRRHSSPLSPEVFSFTDTETKSSRSSTRKRKDAVPTSPTSFMDLSDEEAPNDSASSIISVETPRLTTTSHRIPFSPSTPSLSSEEQADEDRRRKREKLAKLHRFLGSRVPVDLVLAQVDSARSLSPTTPTPIISPAAESIMKNDTDARKVWMRRRRSSSAAEFSGTWSDEIDRLKEDLNEREKAINVRRAVKMEKMFGVAPPQTLYHTRQTLGSTALPPIPSSEPIQPPASSKRSPPQSPITAALRTLNQASSQYNKSRSKKSHRPGTADSTEPLIPENSLSVPHALSDVYLHYSQSLNSLNDIIDRDDRESLVDLHDYLHSNTTEPPLQPFTLQDTSGLIASPSTKSERRRSLPTRTSLTSISSEFSITSPQVSTFETRRRRAAKLTHFFGVDYREYMREIIESIEKGLEEERGRGTMGPEELQKLRKLKVKRNTFI
ncbi:hypothetical protein ABKN59_005088 [Abortiporus biennis]